MQSFAFIPDFCSQHAKETTSCYVVCLLPAFNEFSVPWQLEIVSVLQTIYFYRGVSYSTELKF